MARNHGTYGLIEVIPGSNCRKAQSLLAVAITCGIPCVTSFVCNASKVQTQRVLLETRVLNR